MGQFFWVIQFLFFLEITKGLLIDSFPYYDFVETFEFKGKHILKLLERSMTDLSSLDPVEGPWILQVSGKR